MLSNVGGYEPAPSPGAPSSGAAARGPSPLTQFGGKLASALADIAQGLGRYRLWTALAWEDVKTTYRRSLLGVLWITASFAAFILVKLVIFSPLIGDVDGRYYFVYLAVGFFVWQFISMIMASGPSVFIAAEGWIKNDPLPLSLYVFQSITRTLYNIGLSSIVMVGVLLYAGRPIGPWALLVAPALLALVVNAVWVELFLGVACTRYRDIGHLTQTIMRVMFFVTPIFWMPEQMGDLMTFLWWNPFFHFIEILRAPLIDNEPAFTSWLFVGVVTAIGWAAALTTFGLFRRRIVFWF